MFQIITLRTYLIFQLITRIGLSLYALLHKQILLSELPIIFLFGVFNDFLSVCYFVPIISIFTIILYKPLAKYQIVFLVSWLLFYFIFIFLLLFNSIAELIFWDEFGTRFNFIAVDYLIYTNEILGTVKESLPFYEMVIGLFALTALITFISRNYIIKQAKNFKVQQHFYRISILFFLCITSFYYYHDKRLSVSSNSYAKDLEKNGPYEFVSAFYDNILDYNKLYPVIDNSIALSIVRNNVIQNNQQFINDDYIDRITKTSKVKKRYNIILLVVESLSAEFMGAFGNKKNITPYLDKLSKESIFFTNFYAVGTRTVRGLEAITLSIPPTPGSSIIRRPNNQSLFNIGSIFNKEEYGVNFIFGGYSYFDNLYNYFTNNSYRVIDRNDLKFNEISFSNIWGVADEDILGKSIEIADQHYQKNQKFFSLIMTTSNHRPYTFPHNRIDLPSGGGRDAAVKYTDYAIGKFIEECKQHPWFDDTIFVITADHCASSSGKTDLPVNKYHIPLMIYAPKILQKQQITKLASQIDIAPTILGLLGFNYQTKFFGQDILNSSAERAFIGTYQLLGFMKDNHLVILKPNTEPSTYKLIDDEKEKISNLPYLVEEAISFYQISYNAYIQNKLRE